MGLCSSCFKGSTEELLQPSAEMRRQQQLEAAERRREQSENRGIKDPEKVRRMQQRAQESERREQEAARMGGGQPVLKWTQD
uniref:Putative secreted protein n=1 Tax=Culex tarsalis TaxID=7177 RepID=A0A1Q3FYN9_CULTA